jgi:HK97 family phage portal protein
MKVRLPIIGQVQLGRAKEPEVKAIEIPKTKAATLLGTFLDLGTKSLSTEKNISSKLIEAFYEWVFINVTVLAEEVSKLEPKLYKTVLVKGQTELICIEEHPILDLLDRFNESTTSSDGFYLTESHLELAGDAFWYLEGGANGGQPTNIYLLQPDKIDLVLGDISAGASRLITEYEYKTVIDGDTVAVNYDPEEILHIKVPNPKNPYRGHSVVEGIATTLDIDSNTLNASKNFYENGMMSQFMLSTDNKLTQDQLKKLRAEMVAAYSGSKNFWKIPIFGGGIKPETLQMSSRDAEQLAQQEWLRDKIMAAFKNTKSSLGIVEDVNRSNAESSLLNWKQSTIKPKMSRIVDALNEFLVPRYGDNLILGYEDPVPEDMTRKIADATTLYAAGIITVNEARDMVELETTQDGELIPEEVYSDKSLPKALKSVNTKAAFRKMGLEQKRKDWAKAYESAKPVAKNIYSKELDIVQTEKPLSPHFSNETIWKFWEKQIHMVEVTEKRFENMLNQFISKMIDDGLARVDSEDARKDNNLLNNKQLIQDAVAKFSPILTEIAVSSGNHANRLLKLDKPYIPKTIKGFEMSEQVRKQIELFAASMIETDEKAMVDIIVSGLSEGSSIPAIKTAILEKFDIFTGTQAERITRTEVLKASNAGLEDAYTQSGVVMMKEWLTAGDPCPICDELQGETRDLNEDFYQQGDVINYTNDKGEPAEYELNYDSIETPPVHPNCRCTIIPVLKDTTERSIASTQRELDDLKAYTKDLEELLDIEDANG